MIKVGKWLCLALAVPSFVCLESCVTVKTITGPDGTANQLIMCARVEDCYEKATELCGKYQIVNSISTVSGEPATTTVQLLVKCEQKPAILQTSR